METLKWLVSASQIDLIKFRSNNQHKQTLWHIITQEVNFLENGKKIFEENLLRLLKETDHNLSN